ncbi:MAG: rhomboid family intramembrane serine protease, partial [Rhodobacteraceae bacterium]|nr:rhomboid family intramembrane serine protease [Paracoccaceae bacterium]
MTAIELVLSLAETGYIGTPDWRWSALLVGAFWQPVFSGVVAPVYPGQRAVMCVSYAFLHGGLMHLALNGVVLLSLGKLAASRLGTARTLLVLLLSAVGGALAFGLLASTNVPMIGASGAVFGLIGLWQAWDYGMRREYGLPLRPVISAILALIA